MAAFFAVAHERGDSGGSASNGERLQLGATCGEGERETNGAGGVFGQALALFWSADARRGDLGSA